MMQLSIISMYYLYVNESYRFSFDLEIWIWQSISVEIYNNLQSPKRAKLITLLTSY